MTAAGSLWAGHRERTGLVVFWASRDDRRLPLRTGVVRPCRQEGRPPRRRPIACRCRSSRSRRESGRERRCSSTPAVTLSRAVDATAETP